MPKMAQVLSKHAPIEELHRLGRRVDRVSRESNLVTMDLWSNRCRSENEDLRAQVKEVGSLKGSSELFRG